MLQLLDEALSNQGQGSSNAQIHVGITRDETMVRTEHLRATAGDEGCKFKLPGQNLVLGEGLNCRTHEIPAWLMFTVTQ